MSEGTTPPDHEITVRRAESTADYLACQDAQRRAWGINEDGYVIPVATMVGANLHGGMVLGAFDANGRAVGMSFAFMGRVGDRVCLYSQLTGVIPEYQSKGVGHALKVVQKQIALGEGFDLIAWAFDPLQAGNAHFNIERLGATISRYVENMYGVRTDSLNAGVPTDRLIAEWEIGEMRSPRPPRPFQAFANCPRLIATGWGSSSWLMPLGVATTPEAPTVLLEIPSKIGELRKTHPDAAEAWRRAIKQAFQGGFAAGYRATGFVRDGEGPDRRCFYVLTNDAR